MNEIKLRRLFTELTNAARLLTVYPVLCFCFRGVLKRLDTPLWPFVLLFMAIGLGSLYLSRFVRKRVKTYLWLRLPQLGCILLGIGLGILGCRLFGGSGLEYLFSALIGGFWAFLGCAFSNFELHRFEFFFAAGAYAAAVAVLSWRHFGYPVNAFLIQLILISAIFALEMNFQNIDRLMQRRGHEMSHLPGRIRSFNLVAVLAAVCVLIVLVLLREPLMKATGTILGAIGSVIWFILTPLRNWWNNLDNSSDPHFGEIQADWQGDPANAFEQLVGEEEEVHTLDATTQVNIAIVIVVVGVVAALIYWRKPIFDALRRFLRALSDAFASLFHNLLAKRDFGLDESEYFTDEEERIDDEGRIAAPTDLRAWKKELKAYGKMEESREKYLAGWGLTVKGLTLHGVEVRKSDTPLEILAKAGRVLDKQGYTVATECASVLAFSDHNEPPAWPELHSALETLRNRKIPK